MNAQVERPRERVYSPNQSTQPIQTQTVKRDGRLAEWAKRPSKLATSDSIMITSRQIIKQNEAECKCK